MKTLPLLKMGKLSVGEGCVYVSECTGILTEYDTLCAIISEVETKRANIPTGVGGVASPLVLISTQVVMGGGVI